jgi:single-stranded DNA-binding protein
MNLSFFSGDIIERPIFKFIVSQDVNFKLCTHTSICFFKIKLKNGTIINVVSYDEIADFCYSKLRKGDFIVVSGSINDLYEITIDFCKLL